MLTKWLKKAWGVIRAFDFKESVLAPVMVNLATAFFLFWAVFFFKNPIYNALRPSKPVKQFPIYCVAEGYANDHGIFEAEIYIINRSLNSYTHDELVKLLKDNSDSEDVSPGQIDPTIRVHWRRDQGQITEISSDADFNAAKGRIEITRPKQQRDNWSIEINEISSKAVLRLPVKMDYRGIPITRNAKSSLPFEIGYVGE